MIETSPQNRHLGYARVSTYGQTLDAQLQHFRAEGCAEVYREKASGAQTNRAQLRRHIGQLYKGVVSAHVSCKNESPRPLAVMVAGVFKRSRVERASRSRRITISTRPRTGA